MNQNVEIFNHPEFGQVRVIGDLNNPLFCLSDVCKVLAISNPSDVKNRLDKGVVSIETLQTAGGMQKMTFVNEDGLYDVILDSRKASAKKFRKWVTSEVLPSIRKHGLFIDYNAPIDPRFVRKPADELEARDKQISELNSQVAQLQSKADYCDLIRQSSEALNITVIAKDYGLTAAAMNSKLHELKIQYKVGKQWVLYQPHATLGYAVSDTYAPREGFSVTRTLWTQKGRIFIYNALKKCGILPLIERKSPMATLL